MPEISTRSLINQGQSQSNQPLSSNNSIAVGSFDSERITLLAVVKPEQPASAASTPIEAVRSTSLLIGVESDGTIETVLGQPATTPTPKLPQEATLNFAPHLKQLRLFMIQALRKNAAIKETCQVESIIQNKRLTKLWDDTLSRCKFNHHELGSIEKKFSVFKQAQKKPISDLKIDYSHISDRLRKISVCLTLSKNVSAKNKSFSVSEHNGFLMTCRFTPKTEKQPSSITFTASRNTHTAYDRDQKMRVLTLTRGKEFMQLGEFSKDYPADRYRIKFLHEIGIDVNGLKVEALEKGLTQAIERGVIEAHEGFYDLAPAHRVKTVFNNSPAESYRSLGHILGKYIQHNGLPPGRFNFWAKLSYKKLVKTDVAFSDEFYRTLVHLDKLITASKKAQHNFLDFVMGFSKHFDFKRDFQAQAVLNLSLIFVALRIPVNSVQTNPLNPRPEWLNQLKGFSDQQLEQLHYLADAFFSDDIDDLMADIKEAILPKIALAFGFNEVNRKLKRSIILPIQLKRSIYYDKTLSDRVQSKKYPLFYHSKLSLLDNKFQTAKQFLTQYIQESSDQDNRRLTAFITGNHVLPATNLLFIRIENLNNYGLPKAQTCFNTIKIDQSLLQNYPLFKQKLQQSIVYSEAQGYTMG